MDTDSSGSDAPPSAYVSARARSWFDTFVDRIEGAQDVGVRAPPTCAKPTSSSSHTRTSTTSSWCRMWPVARATGAPVVGSHETIRVMRANGVPEAQCWAVSGGETVECGGGPPLRVLPALHSCLWPPRGLRPVLRGAPCRDERRRRRRCSRSRRRCQRYLACHSGEGLARRRRHALLPSVGHLPRSSQCSSSAGYWTVFMRDLQPDLAMLAVAGRPNLDGEHVRRPHGALHRRRGRSCCAARDRALSPRRVDMPPIPPVEIRLDPRRGLPPGARRSHRAARARTHGRALRLRSPARRLERSRDRGRRLRSRARPRLRTRSHAGRGLRSRARPRPARSRRAAEAGYCPSSLTAASGTLIARAPRATPLTPGQAGRPARHLARR